MNHPNHCSGGIKRPKIDESYSEYNNLCSSELGRFMFTQNSGDRCQNENNIENIPTQNLIKHITSQQGLEFSNIINPLGLSSISSHEFKNENSNDHDSFLEALHDNDHNVSDATTLPHNESLNSTKHSLHESAIEENNKCFPQIYSLLKPTSSLLDIKNFPIPGGLTKETMMEYIKNRNEYDCRINIRSIVVGQKSYGEEKRFLCPPPIIELKNQAGWSKFRNSIDNFMHGKLLMFSDELQKGNFLTQLALQNDGSKIAGSAVLEKLDKVKQMSIEFDESNTLALLKNVYFSNVSQTLKSTKIIANLFFLYGIDLGTFETEKIRIISKPSKKKSNAVRNDTRHLFIESGYKIALFTRMRSQLVHTKYVHVKNGSFVSSPIQWSCLEIFIIDEDKTDLNKDGNCGNFFAKDGNLCFGNIVKIFNDEEGIGLPPLRIMKPDKQYIDIQEHLNIVNMNEPVCQLQKICLQDYHNPTKFISLINDTLTFCDAVIDEKDRNKLQVTDSCILQIVSAKENEYTFYHSSGIGPFPLTPVPVVKGVTETGSDSEYRIELYGSNFAPNQTVWIGSEKLETVMKTSVNMAAVPTREQLEMFREQKMNGDKDLTIYIVREDGIVYPTDKPLTRL
uniref:AAA domain-containing protein n=1 Tax=Strongyloides papillosus TaxID=174720 RepID=A0A0N5B739_STREA